ncbi:enoyl-CoA hydratase/isomerase family protein [Mycobacterium sp. UNC410CL29Cvi84]|uniref:enoyl-CoA hydratase/isomerase family protein n=1 Tax=Mycobacterium sp. UNC410CL29Cvi84 TaxID=1449059 RepID=UPI0009DF34E4|nr:enoyl-CoA hydratase/isomerase family protein [Mycobacterium sp. UNC410CL29Cvi84]
MDADEVLVEHPCDGVAVIKFNRPERLNAVRPSTVSAFAETVARIAADTSIRAVILTGAGRGFCSGVDLSATAEFPPQDVLVATEWMRELFAGALAWSRLPQPTIAVVNGPAIGGGFGFAMACDIRIASPQARFAATFVNIAMGADAGLSHTLPLIVGHATALELLLTAQTVDADEALQLGMVSQVTDDPMTMAIALAQRFAAVPGHLSRGIKATLQRSAEVDLPTAISDVEVRAQAEFFCHPDFFANAARWLNAHA